MTKGMYIMLAPIRLKDGLEENALLQASDTFQRNFAGKQDGILKRLLLRSKSGGYADLVFFESKDEAERICKLEETSPECHEFFRIMEAPDQTLPDMGVMSFEHLKTYE